jgi:hypothetical protein
MEQYDALKQDLLEREKRYWNAIKTKDAQVAARLTDDTCIIVGAQGVGEISRDAVSQMLGESTHELRSFSLDDVHFRRLSNDVVALAYKVSEELTVDGKTINLVAYDSSVWMNRDGEWVCVVHTEAPAGDPFGRH